MPNRSSVAVVAALALALCWSACAQADDGYRKVPCKTLDFETLPGVECGWLTVPESRQTANTRSLTLPVVIGRATNRHHRGTPILYLHGGPGIATLDVVPRALKGKSWPLLRQNHDVIFFDQRGSGRAKPELCPAMNKEMDAISKEGLSSADALPKKAAVAENCAAELRAQNADAASYNAREIAADAEALRNALGIAHWNLFGTSFGSLPALDMVRRYPGTIDALLLDSAFPPNSPYWAEQVSSTVWAMQAVQLRCNEDEVCKSRTPDLLASLQAVTMRLNKTPIKMDDQTVRGDDFAGAFWVMLVQTKVVPMIPEFLHRAETGDNDAIRDVVRAYGGDDTFGGFSQAQSLAGELPRCHHAAH